MTDVRTIWGIRMEWDDATSPQDAKDISIGWEALGDFNALPSSRDAFDSASTASFYLIVEITAGTGTYYTVITIARTRRTGKSLIAETFNSS
jgi:hypothetical protein